MAGARARLLPLAPTQPPVRRAAAGDRRARSRVI